MGKACSVEVKKEKVGAINSMSVTTVAATELTGIKSLADFKMRYAEKGPLKEGSNVQIVLLRDNNATYCLRKVDRNTVPVQSIDELTRYSSLLSGLEHPHICKFVEVFQDKSMFYLIYEKADPTTLFEHIRARKSLNEEDAADYLRQVTMALSFAHSQGVAHGRLSPRTLILDVENIENDHDMTTQVKVCDFGQTFIFRPPVLDCTSSKKSLEVEAYTVSPEQVSKDFDGKTMTAMVPRGAYKNDMWALGCIIYHMLSGVSPFGAVNDRNGLVKLLKAPSVTFAPNIWGKVSDQAQDAVEMMLKITPDLRISASKLLSHPWIKIAKATMPKQRMVKLLGNLRQNVAAGEFKRFVLRVIAQQLPKNQKQTATIEEAFRCLDKNGDGVLTVDEVVRGLSKYPEMKADDLEVIFQAIDRDNSGSVNIQELISATIPETETTNLQTLWNAFNAFDDDKSGHISLSEIEKIVREIEGSLLAKDQVDVLVEQVHKELVDVATNDELDFDQFLTLMNPKLHDDQRKGYYKFCFYACGQDLHNVRHLPVQKWDIHNTGGIVSSPRSVYRRRQTAVGGGRQRQTVAKAG
eukprot:gnl/TRDRNA2_/TRDRNA2_191781_c0_seq1.p1 gnl/TRDRNA2_/TRDRNA2_191781_c0~~gnl/TRDRNA2_/TRDRNA2_191781_c0_seq1.p1  ORF type:complete len:580 (+),score=126.01 gnl/TRDRNA2_/TRDRNA2_191781_c0_seq1:144-1883(+)